MQKSILILLDFSSKTSSLSFPMVFYVAFRSFSLMRLSNILQASICYFGKWFLRINVCVRSVVPTANNEGQSRPLPIEFDIFIWSCESFKNQQGNPRRWRQTCHFRPCVCIPRPVSNMYYKNSWKLWYKNTFVKGTHTRESNTFCYTVSRGCILIINMEKKCTWYQLFTW